MLKSKSNSIVLLGIKPDMEIFIKTFKLKNTKRLIEFLLKFFINKSSYDNRMEVINCQKIDLKLCSLKCFSVPNNSLRDPNKRITKTSHTLCTYTIANIPAALPVWPKECLHPRLRFPRHSCCTNCGNPRSVVKHLRD